MEGLGSSGHGSPAKGLVAWVEQNWGAGDPTPGGTTLSDGGKQDLTQ